MLKGHVFSKQLFENHIFALFINTFLNGEDGVSDNYLNGMEVTYSGSNVTIASGAVCVQGRFIEEDSSATLNAGTSNLYNKLVIEIDLDKQNTETSLNQVSYKIITSSSGYPNLTQSDIVKNNAGIYQYELARFRTNASGITDFQDMRSFLNFESIYQKIQADYQSVLEQLEEELASVEDGSAYMLNNRFTIINSSINLITDKNGITTFSNNVDYPEGFNKDNTYIISIRKGSAVFGNVTSNDEDYKVSYIENSLEITATLNNDNISLFR